MSTVSSINVTQDYNLFKTHFFNRSLQKRNLDLVKESLSRSNLLSVSPIICTNDYEIIDGNHRFHAAKELGLPIHYVKLGNFDIQMLIDLNYSLSKWGNYQFLELYCKLEKPEYLKFKKFCQDYNLEINEGLPLTKSRKERRNLSTIFRKGEFEFTDESKRRLVVEKATEFMYKAKELGFLRKIKKIYSFYDAYEKMMNKDDFSQEKLLSKLSKWGVSLVESGSLMDYYTQLDALYNRR